MSYEIADKAEVSAQYAKLQGTTPLRDVVTLSSHADNLRRMIGTLEDRLEHARSQADCLHGSVPTPPATKDPVAPVAANVLEVYRFAEDRIFGLLGQLAQEQHRLENGLGRSDGPNNVARVG